MTAPSTNLVPRRLWTLFWRSGIVVPATYLLLLFWRAPHLDPHDWDYDEGINLMKALLVGRGYHLFAEIWSDQPPLLTVALAGLFQSTGPSTAAARVLIMLLSALLLWAFYLAVQATLPADSPLGAQAISPAKATVIALLASLLLVLSEFYLRLSGAVMVGLPSTALAMLSLALLVTGRAAWPRLALAALLMALALQTKLLAALIVPAAAVAVYLAPATSHAALSSLRFNWQRRLRLTVAWSALLAALYLLIGFALGALRFDLLFGTHLSALAGNVENFVQESSSFFPHFLEQHVAYLILAAAGLAYAACCRTPAVLVPLAWLTVAAAAFAIQRPLWYHHTLLLSVPLTWLAAYGIAGLAWALRRAWQQPHSWNTILAGILGVVAIVSVLLSFWFYPNPLPERLAWQMTIYRPNYIPQVAERLQADAAGAGKNDWIFTDHPFYAFQAGLPVPPPIAVLSRKTLEANIIRQETLAKVLRDYAPRFVLFERFTDSYSPEVMDEIHAHYNKEIEEGPARYYIRHE